MAVERVGLDTAFFIRLFEASGEVLRIWDRIVACEVRPVVSVCVLFELERLVHEGVVNPEALRIVKEILKLLGAFTAVDTHVAVRAAKIAHGTGMSFMDAVICATYIDCDEVYTDREAFGKVYPKQRPRLFMV